MSSGHAEVSGSVRGRNGGIPFRRVAMVGLGALGGSLARALAEWMNRDRAWRADT